MDSQSPLTLSMGAKRSLEVTTGHKKTRQRRVF
jgi:hypothetical protein